MKSLLRLHCFSPYRYLTRWFHYLQPAIDSAICCTHRARIIAANWQQRPATTKIKINAARRDFMDAGKFRSDSEVLRSIFLSHIARVSKQVKNYIGLRHLSTKHHCTRGSFSQCRNPRHVTKGWRSVIISLDRRNSLEINVRASVYVIVVWHWHNIGNNIKMIQKIIFGH